jgi:hypothetical protein
VDTEPASRLFTCTAKRKCVTCSEYPSRSFRAAYFPWGGCGAVSGLPRLPAEPSTRSSASTVGTANDRRRRTAGKGCPPGGS